MKIRIFLRRDTLSKRTNNMRLGIRISHKNLVFKTKVPTVQVAEKYWDTNSELILQNKKHEPYNKHVEYNIIISDIKRNLDGLYRSYLLTKNELTTEQFKNALIGPVGSGTNEDTKNNIEKPFFECFDNFICLSKSTKATRTITGYKTTKNVFLQYANERKVGVTFGKINLSFFDDFKQYCFVEKGFSDNYFAKIIAHLKTFMLWASEREFHQNSLYTKFKASEHDIEVIFLNQEELGTLFYHEFKSEKLDRVRDVFCFACFTGLRYSDLANLTRSNIVDGQIKLNVKKTKQKDLLIPLNSYSKSILKKYKDSKYKLLPIISIQKLNAYIKEACKEAGIDFQTKITRYSGGNVTDENLPKYELITIHTARKTFVSNSLMFDIPVAVIKEVTGHKTDRAFQKYVKVTDSYKKEKLGAWENSLEKK